MFCALTPNRNLWNAVNCLFPSPTRYEEVFFLLSRMTEVPFFPLSLSRQLGSSQTFQKRGGGRRVIIPTTTTVPLPFVTFDGGRGGERGEFENKCHTSLWWREMCVCVWRRGNYLKPPLIFRDWMGVYKNIFLHRCVSRASYFFSWMGNCFPKKSKKPKTLFSSFFHSNVAAKRFRTEKEGHTPCLHTQTPPPTQKRSSNLCVPPPK